jgi:hypothetical protein
MKTGLAILWEESKFNVIISVFSGIILTVIIYLSFKWYIEFVVDTPYSIFDIIVSIGLLSLFIYTIAKHYLKEPARISYRDRRLRFIIGFLRIILNIRISLNIAAQERKIKGLTQDKIRIQPQFSLKHRPNVFLLFVESYGSILMQDKEMKWNFRNMYNSFAEHLTKNDWGIVSNLSRAPSSSAFSWLCYASLMHGYNISEHALYERYVKNPLFYNSDSLFRIFNNQGYTTYFLNPIKPNPRIKINYNYLTPFYAIDQWILFEDLEYSGDRYGFGDCPPDQYSLHKAREIIEEKSIPYALFFLTKNSHSPFIGPEKLESNWNDLNQSDGKSNYGGGFLARPTIQNYLKAIKYQLEVVEDFIIHTANDNDIYFVIGDHQPPVLCDVERNGFNTPIHIISKNESFLEGFFSYGFKKSIFDSSLHNVRHESMYSVILREMIRTFGTDYKKLPSYEPSGLQI